MALPQLVREGRQRPVPCQVTQGPAGEPQLWWVLESLPAGATAEYTLTEGVRRRASPARVVASPIGVGTAVTVRGRPFAEVHIPQHAWPWLNLVAAPGPPAKILHLSFIGDESPTPHPSWVPRRRSLAPLVSGPVFCRLGWTTWCLDARQLPSLEEETILQITDAGDQVQLVDYTVVWRAISQPVAITAESAPQTPGAGAWAVPRFVVETGAAAVEHGASPGWRDSEVDGCCSPFAWQSAPGRLIAVLAGENPFDVPPRWRVRRDTILEGVPAIENVRLGTAPLRLELGESCTFTWRLIVSTGDVAVSELPAHYLQFHRPPEVTLTPTDRDDDPSVVGSDRP